MAELMLMKAPGGHLIPADEEAEAIISKWPLRAGFLAKVTRKRNYRHHCKFMALVGVVKHYSDTYDTQAKALVAVKIAADHVDWVPSPVTGELVPIPKSISFENMEQFEFDQFYDRAVNGVLKHLLPAMNRASLEQAADMVVRF